MNRKAFLAFRNKQEHLYLLSGSMCVLMQVLAGEKEWTRSTEFRCKDLTYTVSGLTDGADYYIRVIAVNDAGPGAPGVTEPVTVKEPQGQYALTFRLGKTGN